MIIIRRVVWVIPFSREAVVKLNWVQFLAEVQVIKLKITFKKKQKKKTVSDRGCSKPGGVVGRWWWWWWWRWGGSVEEIKSIETEVEAGVKSSVVTSLLHIEPVVESQRR